MTGGLFFMQANFNISGFLKDIILPPVCVLCGRLSQSPLCGSCNCRISFLGSNVCSRCGKPLDDLPPVTGKKFCAFDKKLTSVNICNLCKIEEYHFYAARSFSLYKGTIAELISLFKYRKYYYLDATLAGFLKHAYEVYYKNEKIDYIDTVPDYNMTAKSAASCHELNHMQVLAHSFAQKTKLQFADNILKIRKTQRQQLLGRDQRITNLEGVFKVRDCLKAAGKNILLVDDVFTTGSTLNEISVTLKNAGAKRIYLLTLARGA
jgi:ComF family protein